MPMLNLKPACKDYLWGSQKLHTDFGFDSPLAPLAEAWVLSCHPDGPSTIVGGPHDGQTLAVKKGDSVFIPADSGDFAVAGPLQPLCARV